MLLILNRENFESFINTPKIDMCDVDNSNYTINIINFPRFEAIMVLLNQVIIKNGTIPKNLKKQP